MSVHKQFPIHSDFLDKVPFGICLVDEQYQILVWNRLLEIWTGRMRDDMVGSVLLTEYPHLNKAPYKKRFDSVLSAGSPLVFSPQLHSDFWESSSAGNKHYHQVTVSLYTDDNMKKYLVICSTEMTLYIQQLHSITTLRKRALAMEKARIEKERLQVLIGTLGAICHNINQPLTSLNINAHLLKTMADGNGKITQIVTDIQMAIQQICQITEKLQGITQYQRMEYVNGSYILDIDQASNT